MRAPEGRVKEEITPRGDGNICNTLLPVRRCLR